MQEWSNFETGFLERLWRFHPWMHSKPNWTRTCSSQMRWTSVQTIFQSELFSVKIIMPPFLRDPAIQTGIDRGLQHRISRPNNCSQKWPILKLWRSEEIIQGWFYKMRWENSWTRKQVKSNPSDLKNFTVQGFISERKKPNKLSVTLISEVNWGNAIGNLTLSLKLQHD